jgi:flagellar assembly protein FliH
MNMSTDTLFSELSYPSLVTTAAIDGETERARVRGHAAGYAAGLRAAEAQAVIIAEHARTEREALRGDAATALESALAALETAAARAAALDALVLSDADQSLAAAAIELAEAILERELADGGSSARVAIARALSSASTDSVLAVRLSPVDLAVVSASGLAPSTVTLVADSTLERGDAIVDVAEGRVDARISSSLQRARAEIGAIR